MKGKSIFLKNSLFIALLLFESMVVTNVKIAAQKRDSEPPTERRTKVKTGIISGIVYYPNSTKVAGAALIDLEEDRFEGGWKPAIATGIDGKFRLAVAPGRYEVCAWKQSENYLLPNGLPFGLPVNGKCERVTVSEDEEKTVNLRLAEQVNSLSGKIRNWKSLLLPAESKVIIYRPLKSVNEHYILTSLKEAVLDLRSEVRADKNGRFTVNGLPAGTYFLRIEIPGRETYFYRKNKSDAEPTPIEIRNKAENRIAITIH